jgi:hypothetical protein
MAAVGKVHPTGRTVFCWYFNALEKRQVFPLRDSRH